MLKFRQSKLFRKILLPVFGVLFFCVSAYAAVTLTVSNEFKFENGKGNNDFSSDTYKVILMASGFTFDQDADGTYSDLSADEITSAGGYTVGGETLAVDSAWAQDNVNDKAAITWQDKTFTASGDDFDTFCAACIMNYSFGTSNPLIVGCIEFGQDIDVTDGNSFQLQDLGFDRE